jgi:hypothetical protein
MARFAANRIAARYPIGSYVSAPIPGSALRSIPASVPAVLGGRLVLSGALAAFFTKKRGRAFFNVIGQSD